MSKKTKGKEGISIRPLGDRVLIKEMGLSKEEQTSSGIFLPESAREDKNQKLGKVVAVGDGKFDDGKLVPVRIKEGETVLYTWGDKIKIEEEEYVVVRETEVIAVISGLKK